MTVSDHKKGSRIYNMDCKIGSGQEGSGSTITEEVVGTIYLREVSVPQQERIKSTTENSQINRETGRIYQRQRSSRKIVRSILEEG
jgi:hypothetical protein